MSVDLVQIIGNISQAIIPVQSLITGLAYMVGILFVIHSIMKFRQIGDARAGGGSREKMFIPIAYLLGGAALIFLPSSLQVLSNTTFGVTNALEYTQFNPYNIYSAMKIIIQTAGIIWFIRGCVLLSHASEPGVQEGPKGLTFLFAGILAMNFEGTIGALDYSLTHLINFSLKIGA
jgi:hypothetical protein